MPDYDFTYVPEILGLEDVDVEPFYYDADLLRFIVGNRQFNLEDVKASDLLPESRLNEQHVGVIEGFELPIRPITDFGVAVSFSGFLGTPRLFDACDTGQKIADLRREVVEVMHSAFDVVMQIRRNDDYVLPKSFLNPDSLFGFDFGYYRPGHPSFNVMGNCACLGVIPEGFILDDMDREKGFMEFDLHNIDFDFQEIALLAGLGHMSYRVKSA